jgi:hypothetical protein
MPILIPETLGTRREKDILSVCPTRSASGVPPAQTELNQ